jgi:hypothetical protein
MGEVVGLLCSVIGHGFLLVGSGSGVYRMDRSISNAGGSNEGGRWTAAESAA